MSLSLILSFTGVAELLLSRSGFTNDAQQLHNPIIFGTWSLALSRLVDICARVDLTLLRRRPLINLFAFESGYFRFGNKLFAKKEHLEGCWRKTSFN